MEKKIKRQDLDNEDNDEREIERAGERGELNDQVSAASSPEPGTACLSYVHVRWCAVTGTIGFRCVHLVFDIVGEREECLLDLDVILGGNLEEWYA